MANANSTGTLFSDLASALQDIDNGIFKQPGLAKDIKAAAEELRQDVDLCLDQVPANIWVDENGMKTIQVAIPGKTKENVKVSLATIQGKRYLSIEANAPELTDEQKAAEEKRTYRLRKIRGMTSLSFKVPCEETLDVTSLKAKVENGLLTITIPRVPEAQPVLFTID